MITVLALILMIVGALNRMSVGIFDFNFINWIFTPQAYIGARVLYAIVGLAGIWTVVYLIYNKFSPRRINAIEKGASKEQHAA